MVSACLESLPTDLILTVLEQLSSPRDLYGLIRASSACYQIFSAHQALVLAAVIQEAIPREVLPDAIAACDASAVREVSSVLLRESDEDSVASKRTMTPIIRKFMNDYQRHDKLSLTRLRDLSLLTSLCRLWATVDYFISRYTKEALQRIRERILKGGLCPSSCNEVQDSSQELSKTELCRLQRAFFRYEIHRKLFTSVAKSYESGPIFGASDQAQLFMTKFPIWEQEELACVFDYLMVHAQDCFDKLEDDFVKTVQEGAGAAEASETLREGDYLDESGLDILGYTHFIESQKSRDHPDLLLWIIGLGLPYLKNIAELNQPGRLNLIYWFVSPFNTVRKKTKVLNIFHASSRAGGERVGRTSPDTNSLFVDTLTGWNMGWIWARASETVAYHVYRPEDCTIISMGYVFWDANRLRAMGLLENPRHDLKQVPRRNRKDMPSPEKRLEGVQMSYFLREFLDNEYKEDDYSYHCEPDLENSEY
ncbi:hypothetical protein MMC11_008550 [Xylographa trunciseda]|nr:hypothetical protein [Xylographa trunciseda]